MHSYRVSTSAGNPLDRVLERRILERLDLPARVADEMMVMLSARVGALVSRDPVTQVDALREAELVEALERAIDAGDADPRALPSDGVVNLLGGEAAVLAPEELDHDATRASASSARRPESCERRLGPLLRHRR